MKIFEDFHADLWIGSEDNVEKHMAERARHKAAEKAKNIILKLIG